LKKLIIITSVVDLLLVTVVSRSAGVFTHLDDCLFILDDVFQELNPVLVTCLARVFAGIEFAVVRTVAADIRSI